MAKPDIEISQAQWNIVQAILQRYLPNYSVWAFGSRAKKQAKPYSDLDIAIIGEQSMPISLLAEVNEAFDESDLPWKVDIVDWPILSDAFKTLIKQHYVVLQNAANTAAEV